LPRPGRGRRRRQRADRPHRRRQAVPGGPGPRRRGAGARHRPARRPRRPGPPRGRAALRPARRAQAQLPRGGRGARRHRRGGSPPREAGHEHGARRGPRPGQRRLSTAQSIRPAQVVPDGSKTTVLAGPPAAPSACSRGTSARSPGFLSGRPPRSDGAADPRIPRFAPARAIPALPPGARAARLDVVSRTWAPDSWRGFPAAQQPSWADEGELEAVLKQLATLPPLVFAGEARSLTSALGQVARGEAFLLQAGDCAESFDELSADNIRDKLKVILQMAIVLSYSAGVPVVKVGRIAGQFAKPRSSDTERIGDLEIPSFRGHMVN